MIKMGVVVHLRILFCAPEKQCRNLHCMVACIQWNQPLGIMLLVHHQPIGIMVLVHNKFFFQCTTNWTGAAVKSVEAFSFTPRELWHSHSPQKALGFSSSRSSSSASLSQSLLHLSIELFFHMTCIQRTKHLSDFWPFLSFIQYICHIYTLYI